MKSIQNNSCHLLEIDISNNHDDLDDLKHCSFLLMNESFQSVSSWDQSATSFEDDFNGMNLCALGIDECANENDSDSSCSDTCSSESSSDSSSDSNSDSSSGTVIDPDGNSCDNDERESESKNSTFILDDVEFPSIEEDCEEGDVPLRRPNAVYNDSKSIADMVNILANPKAAETFASAEKSFVNVWSNSNHSFDDEENIGCLTAPHPMYDCNTSEVMKNELLLVKSQIKHVESRRYGHVVEPGHISFYKYSGVIFAVPEGRWYLSSVTASWLQQNVSLDAPIITLKKSNIKIIRIMPDEVGFIAENNKLVILDAGTHVFNSDNVQIIGKDLCSNL